MTLYETIFARRQVRRFTEAAVDAKTLEKIWQCVQSADSLSGQQARFEMAQAENVSGNQGAPYYLLSFCENAGAAYANVGYILQKADLYIQSLGLGSGWFMGAKPRKANRDFCIALAFGQTEVPMRTSEAEFKRKRLIDVCPTDSPVARAVRVAPSSLNSQPWKLRLQPGKAVIEETGKGVARIVLKNKLNKIDLGIAARHAVIALEQEGKTVSQILSKETGKQFEILIVFG